MKSLLKLTLILSFLIAVVVVAGGSSNSKLGHFVSLFGLGSAVAGDGAGGP